MVKAASAREALMVALQPYMEWAAAQLMHEVVRAQVAGALHESAVEKMEIERAALQFHRVLPQVVEAIVSEEVRWTAPDIAKEFVVEAAAEVLAQRRADAVWKTVVAEVVVDVAREAFRDAVADDVAERLVEEAVADLAPELAEIQAELRRAEVLEAIEAAARERVANDACLRHLTRVLGTNGGSVLVHRGLVLKTAAATIARLDAARRAATASRDRLRSEPLLAAGMEELLRPAAIAALESDLGPALESYDAALQEVEDAAYGRRCRSVYS